MAIFNFICKACNQRHQTICSHKELTTIIETNVCGSLGFYDPITYADITEGCGGSLKQELSMPNIINQTTGKYSLNGYYSKSLGAFVDSPAAEEKIMNKRGFVRESDLGAGFWESKTESIKNNNSKKDADVKQISKDIASGMNAGEAYAKTFSAERALSGDLENTYKE